MPRVTNPEQARYNGDEFNHISVVRPVAGRGNLPHTLTAMLSEVKARRSTQREKLRDFGLKFAVFYRLRSVLARSFSVPAMCCQLGTTAAHD